MRLLAVAFGVLALHGSSPARLQVVAKEFSFELSRVNLKPGPAVIELANFGQDPHDLRLQRVGSRHIAGIGVVAPGQRGEVTVKLARGRYSFWCSVANHRKLGMHATLLVR